VSSISAIFRTRTSSIIYQNYIEIREGMGNPGRLLTATAKIKVTMLSTFDVCIRKIFLFS
jgi:hypothetical protein